MKYFYSILGLVISLLHVFTANSQSCSGGDEWITITIFSSYCEGDVITPSEGPGVQQDGDFIIQDTSDDSEVANLDGDGESWTTVAGSYRIFFVNGAAMCNDPVEFTVNPIPSVDSTDDILVCSGVTIEEIVFTGSAVPGTDYIWENSNPAIGLSETIGSGNIESFEATNITQNQISSDIMVTPVFNGCPGESDNFEIKVNPNPDNFGPAQINGQNEPYCVGDVVGLSAEPDDDFSYEWVRPNGDMENGSDVNFVAASSDNGPWTVAKIDDLTLCRTPIIFNLTVNDLPNVSSIGLDNQSLCNGEETDQVNFTTQGSPFFTTYSWTNTNENIGLADSDTLVDAIPPFFVTNGTNETIFGTIEVTPTQSQTGCVGPSKSFDISVKPTPTLSPIADVTECRGAQIVVDFESTVADTDFNWTNSDDDIGLGLMGTGDLNFPAANGGVTQIFGTILVNPIAEGCQGSPESFIINVNPAPTLTNPLPQNQEHCNGEPTDSVVFSSNIGGTTYNWVNDNPSIGLGSNNNGNIGSFEATNDGFVAIDGMISVTPTGPSGLGSCQGTPVDFTITVNPTPDIDPVADVELCAGEDTDQIDFGSSVTGTTFSWTSNNSAIGLDDNGSGSILSFQATNTGTDQIFSDIEAFTLSPKSCVGDSTEFRIRVNPLPTVAFANQESQYCEGTALDISVNDLGDSYSWRINGENSTSNSDVISDDAEVGDSQVTVIGTDDNNCVNFDTLDITVFIDYDVSFDPAFASGYLLCKNDAAVDYEQAVSIDPPLPADQTNFQFPVINWSLAGTSGTSTIIPADENEGIDQVLVINLENGACPADSATAQVPISILSLPDVDPVLEITDYCQGDTLELCVTENDVATNTNSLLDYLITYPSNVNSGFEAATDGSITCLGPDGALEIPIVFNGGAGVNQETQSLSLDASYTYTISGIVKQCSLNDLELEIDDVTRAYQPEFTAVLDGSPFCQEDVVQIKSEDIISTSNGYPLDQGNSLITNEFDIELDGDFVSTNAFGEPFDAVFSDPATAPLDDGDYVLNYQLDFGSCERSITNTFEIRPFPAAVDIDFDLCEDTLEVISLETIVNQFNSNYVVVQDTLFTVSQSDSSLIALDDGQFTVNTESITAQNGIQTITFNYDADTISTSLFTILDSDGCMVPDSNQFRVRIMPEIEAFLTTELYFCETVGETIGLDSIRGGNGQSYNYRWQFNGIDIEDDDGEPFIQSTFPLGSNQAEDVITRTLLMGAPVFPGGQAVCRAETSVTVTINNDPINAVLSDDVFSSYCSEESSTFSIENWTRAEGFIVDSAEILFFDNPPSDPDAIPGLTPVNIPGWTFWQDNADTINFIQTLSPGDYPGNSPSLPNDINYVTGFYLNPIHNCNTYEAAGVNFPYIASTSTSQPFPQILSAAGNQVCPGGVITLEATADSSATNQWNIQPNLAFTPNENDPMNSIDVTIPTNLIGTTIIVNLNQESSDSDCLGTDADTLIFNSNGISPGSKDYFIDPVSDFIIYNDSGLCYQWGLIETIVADGEPMNVFTELEGQNFQSFELDIRPDLDPQDILCRVSFKENGGCPADPNCFTIAPKRLGTGNPVVIEPQSSDILWLYPNPNNGQFSVALNDLIPDRRYSLEVYNYLGQPIWQETFVSEREDYVRPIAMPNVANGMYSLRMLIEDRPIARLSFILNR